ncbi:MAG: sulfatase [Candidatus Hydrogenedentota bacterium]|nr:MAG: sulfatase [Candidatus Hydrogenedentota bacterium]
MNQHDPNDTLCTGPWAVDGLSRRDFLNRVGLGMGGIALAQLVGTDTASATTFKAPHFAPRAKRIIYLFQSGGPSQLDLFDYKPMLNKRNGEELPDSVRQGQRLTGMSAHQSSLPMAGSIFDFQQHGESGAWVSDLMPHTAKIVDELCIIKSMYTEAINHDPAITFFQTGSQIAGRPSLGSWLSYGLGTENDNLPAYVALVTKGKGGQPLYSRLWGSGFLPSEHQGVQFRSGADPVLYLNNPGGIGAESRRMLLDKLADLHSLQSDAGNAMDARIAQYEMAFRMQTSVPEVTDFSDEPGMLMEAYGPDVHDPGSYAANCLLARRLIERDVRCVQLFHRGWDQHGGLPKAIKTQCTETDQPTAALIRDLKQRGLLEETLVVWGGEFGRTNYSQGTLTETDYGRDHHPRCFTVWMAGGGVKAGTTYGVTDEFGYNIVENGVHVHDFHATLLHLLGIDHERLTFPYKGRQFRITDVHGKVVKALLA